jgi:hypothetical protein
MTDSSATTVETPANPGTAPPPHLEPDPTGFADDAAPSSEAVLRQWDPERQYIGSLLWLPAGRARAMAELVPGDALVDHLARWAHELITARVAAGADPNPVLVLRAARRRPATGAPQPGRPPSAQQVKALSLYLFDVYSAAIAPRTAVLAYAREVLDSAYRRGFARLGVTMQHLAETGCTRAELDTHFAAICRELAALRKHCDTVPATAQAGP